MLLVTASKSSIQLTRKNGSPASKNMDCRSNLPGSFKVFVLIALLMSCTSFAADSRSPKETRHSQVLILGAGMSGIAAAKTLQQHGIRDFVILEGYERIGGRMRHVEFAGTVVELGANWVGGTEHNPIWVLAQKYGLKGAYTMAHPTPGCYIVRNETGHDVTHMDKHEEFQEAIKNLDSIVEKRRQSGKGDLDAQTGIRLAGWQAENPVQSTVEYFYYDFSEAIPPHYITCSVEMLTNGSIDSTNGKQYFISDPRGYSHIVDEMAQSFLSPDDPRLLLNHTVDVINWDRNGVSVSTKTGDVFTADYLLVTFSVGVLKSNAVSFKPQLPPQILEPIYKVAMANYIKIFLKFPYRFWDERQYIFYASRRRGYYPVWEDLQVDGGLPDDVSILFVTVTGEEATRVQFQSEDNTKAEIMEVLRSVYGDGIPEATNILYKRWGRDPLFYGTYSNPPIGMTHQDYLALQTNVSRIYFAGEATHELYFGFVHGAYFSGVERADKLAHDILNNRG